MVEQVAPDAAQATDLDPSAALADLLEPVGLSPEDTGGQVTFAGADPMVPEKVRLGAGIGIPMMAGAVGAAALHRIRTGVGQDLHLDLRQAIHHVVPHAFWRPTLNGDLPEHALVADNPFLLDPYRTKDGRTVMACGVYPHMAASWGRFLDVPPDKEKVAAAFARWDAFELEEVANAAGLPITVARTPQEWLDHPQGALLASQPVIGLKQIGEEAVADFGPAQRPLDGIKVLSFTHALAGPTVGRTMSEHGAQVLCGTRANDYEHTFIYVQANIGSRSALLDLSSEAGQQTLHELLSEADVVVNNHRYGKLERLGLAPQDLAEKYPGLTKVSITCYGNEGPWADRGGFDMNGSAASGLMSVSGSPEEPKLPLTGMINDFITGYVAAAGATAALVKRATVGGSWEVSVNLTRNAMWVLGLGAVDPRSAKSDAAHTLGEPKTFSGDTPLGRLHFPGPQVDFSQTPPAWPAPALVPRGSSQPVWL
ncbi:CoA transferase [Pseudactinotalea sp. Z1748]|uniref:CoA transferase n=1 Tax=Pseudactinotalea sp. Z1748 TaxID=3413027 RepID=UPI003C7BB4C1